MPPSSRKRKENPHIFRSLRKSCLALADVFVQQSKIITSFHSQFTQWSKWLRAFEIGDELTTTESSPSVWLLHSCVFTRDRRDTALLLGGQVLPRDTFPSRPTRSCFFTLRIKIHEEKISSLKTNKCDEEKPIWLCINREVEHDRDRCVLALLI